MVERKELHALVDSLPEVVLESVQRYLKSMQVWPPPKRELPPGVEQQQKRLEEMRHKFLKHRGGSGGWVMNDRNKMFGSFTDGEQNPETGELTVQTFRIHDDFPLEITERFRMSDNDRTLHYEFNVSGLGKEHGFALEFNAPDAISG